MNLGQWALDRKVLVNLAVLLVLGTGTFALLELPREVFPSFSNNQISVTAVYPGASPSEVELLVSAKIEQDVAELTGVEEVRSISEEGFCRITLDLLDSAPEMGRMIDDVKAAIDSIDDFPEEVEEPVVQEIETRFPVINAALFGDLDPGIMKDLADDIEDDLRRIEGVSQVVPAGVPERVVWVEPDQERLREFDLTVGDVEAALRARNLNFPGGNLTTRRGSILVRTLGEIEAAEELGEIPLKSGRGGMQVTLGRVAKVHAGFDDPPRTLSFVAGRRALTLTVFKDESGDAIKISTAVQEYCATRRAELPPGVDLATHGDFSVYIQNRLRTMNSTAVLALFLVLACLYLFLSGRIAFLTALGIPVAFLGAAAVMYFLGESFNMVAMFAFIIVLGMVVDDAIVLCENVYRHLEQGKSPRQAAIDGTREVAAPVLCTVTTTVAAFLPMLMISGDIGKYLMVIPIVVALTLAFSIFEALFALPVHIFELMTWTRSWKASAAPLSGFLDWMTRHYRRLVQPALKYRYLTLAVLFATTIVICTLGARHLKTELFGEIESKQFFINLESSPTVRIEEMAERIVPVQQRIAALPEQELESFNSNVGILFQDVARFETGPHKAQVYVDLREGTERERDSETIINELRDDLDQVPGVRKLQIVRPGAGPQVPAIEVGVQGEDFDDMLAAADLLVERLNRIDGVRDIRTDYEHGKEELQLRIRPEAEALGLDVATLATQIRNRFLYAEASRMHRTREAPEIRVRLPESQRSDVREVLDSWIRLPNGEQVPVSELVEVDRQRGPSKIARVDQHRTVSVLADVDRKKANPAEVIADLSRYFPTLAQQWPGVRARVKGESLEMEKSMQDLMAALSVALAVIYILLATLFRSYFQPLVVMAVIPFAVDGVILGHLLLDQNLSMLSMMGFVALAGIVVNDSLVLVSFVNEQARRHGSLMKAVIEGGALRVRPILLTSITTIVGLVPLAFFSTGQARFLAPMAVSIVWGLAFTTVLTLIAVPCLYLVHQDLRALVSRQKDPDYPPDSVSPASPSGPL